MIVENKGAYIYSYTFNSIKDTTVNRCLLTECVGPFYIIIFVHHGTLFNYIILTHVIILLHFRFAIKRNPLLQSPSFITNNEKGGVCPVHILITIYIRVNLLLMGMIWHKMLLSCCHRSYCDIVIIDTIFLISCTTDPGRWIPSIQARQEVGEGWVWTGLCWPCCEFEQ